MIGHKHRARKRFGQNFLHSRAVINAIIDSIKPKATDHLVEIGPGLGALTKPLLQQVEKLHAIELDHDLIEHLQKDKSISDHNELILHNVDVLEFNFQNLYESYDTRKKLRLVGNLPYNISTPLLFHTLRFRTCIEDMHFMLQKELGDRISASQGSKAYGRLSVLMQYFCTVESLFQVSPSAFKPQPKVDSVILRIIPKSPASTQEVTFEALQSATRQAFSARRKTLRNNFRDRLSEAEIAQAGISPDARAETLDLTQFIALAKLCEFTANSDENR